MPSIRKRLKKLASGKKSKSTSDLDNIGEQESQPVKDDDTHSYASEAVSERTDVSFNESTFSYASNSEDGKKKKKRKLKVRLTKKKKKDVLVKDPSGNVVFRSMSIEHDPRGEQQSNRNNFDEEYFLKTEDVELSKSVESNVSKDELSEADSWRMSGLLENVNRTSNTSLNDNLLLNFEERRRKATKDVNAESTPIKDNFSPEVVASVEEEEAGEKSGKIKTSWFPTVEVSLEAKEKRPARDKASKSKCDTDRDIVQEGINGDGNDNSEDDLVAFSRDLEPVQEEDLTEMRNVDPECEIDIDETFNEDRRISEESAIKRESTKETDGEKDKCIHVINERSVVCDAGKGKKVIIRHLEEVVSNASMEISDNVSMEDWLVLNIEKDDWVVVGYTKVGGEVTQLFEQSVDTI